MKHTRVWWLVPAAVIIAAAAIAPLFVDTSSGQGDIPYSEPSAQAWLGTDHLGRSILPQLLTGGWRIILIASTIAVLVTALAAMAGTVAALQPRLGAVIERATDAAMLVPPILAIMLVLLSWPSAGTAGLIVVAVLVGTPYSARVFAAAANGVAASGFIDVAVASGERLPYLAVREVLPNLRDTTLTQLGLRFVEAMYLVSTAAFLALPASLGESNWALMVRENSGGVLLNPWAVAAPALALALVAISLSVAVEIIASRRTTP
ncbi:ABC transporter permease subunit [Gordonia insulae]|uniref:Glutathione transport system permease protein GsiD n=1 Tax=Gordonia insulae TaxID=2420509 RepID=A0A3G8JMX9_9ACTN|nr:ABC transporter permease subunit [Gordonia insulae]AZG46258.1 Glutathione transport system permease protein GsiD [Gordonia insulae]